MQKLTPAEEQALHIMMTYIEDNDSLNIIKYCDTCSCIDSVTETQIYNPNAIDEYCYVQNHSGNPIFINLTSKGNENMCISIYPPNSHGSRNINFVYTYDESDGSEEWYEKKAFWFGDFTLQLFDTEEEYFQASTVDDLVLTYEENEMFITFTKTFLKNLNNMR